MKLGYTVGEGKYSFQLAKIASKQKLINEIKLKYMYVLFNQTNNKYLPLNMVPLFFDTNICSPLALLSNITQLVDLLFQN